MKKCLFTGVCTALVTPFEEGKVNFAILENLLQRQIDAGIQAVVLCGTTGESPTLTEEEKISIFRFAKEQAGNRMTIIAGTGSNNTSHVLELSRKAEDAGADGLLVVSPYYNKATNEGLIAHYEAILEAVDIPIIVYNVPSRTGQDIPVEVYHNLSRHNKIAGVKEAGGNITKISKTIALCGEDLPVWSGNDDMILPVMALGGKGVISVVSNIVPKESKALTDAALQGDQKIARALQYKLLPLIEALFCQVNPIPVKEAMKILGYDCGPCRLPLTSMDDQKRRMLQKILENLEQ